MNKLIRLKENYYKYLDKKSRHVARLLSMKRPITNLLLKYINELYNSARLDASFKNKNFESAYHNPISSDLEFLVARILYHYSIYKKLNWKIYLRRQVGKTAPDIRIDKNGKTIAIVEIKAKAGWIQSFFSVEKFRKDMKRFKEGKTKKHPNELLKVVKKQFKKYYQEFNIKPDKIFVLLPTWALVHRKKSTLRVKDYYKEFAKNSGLPKDNLILLSNNLLLNLSSNSVKQYLPTDRFERFIGKISK